MTPLHWSRETQIFALATLGTVSGNTCSENIEPVSTKQPMLLALDCASSGEPLSCGVAQTQVPISSGLPSFTTTAKVTSPASKIEMLF